jgi:hypothetical protein
MTARRAPIAAVIDDSRGVPNIVFSLCAAVASLLIAILAAAKGIPVVAIVWGALAVGFLLRAAFGYRRKRG